MSEEDDGVVRTGPAGGGIVTVGPEPADYCPVDPHKVIVVCHTALRRRTRWALSLTRRKTDVVSCPRCARKAYVEVVEGTSESAHFTFPSHDDQAE